MNAMEHAHGTTPTSRSRWRSMAAAGPHQRRDHRPGRRRRAAGHIGEPDIDAKLRGEQTPRGWGLFLVRSLVDEVHETGDGTQHTLTLELRLGGEAVNIDAPVHRGHGAPGRRTAPGWCWPAASTAMPRTACWQPSGGRRRRRGAGRARPPRGDLHQLQRPGGDRRPAGRGPVRAASRVAARGLTDHYRHLFEITRLTDLIEVEPAPQPGGVAP